MSESLSQEILPKRGKDRRDLTSNGISKYHFKQLDLQNILVTKHKAISRSHIWLQTLNMITEGYFIFFF